MSRPHEIAPATASIPLGVQGEDGVAANASPRPAQPFPTAAAARALLVRRSMALHFVLAQDHADKLTAEGHADAARITIQGLRDAADALEGRLDRGQA